MRRRNKNKKQVKILIATTTCILLLMTVGYAAFSTNLSITAKGNIVNEYPQSGLLLHLDASKRGTDPLKWQDLSPAKQDCTLRNFDNNINSGWNNNNLTFDGVDDNVLCAQINPDHVTLLVNFKPISFKTNNMCGHANTIVANWESGGFGAGLKNDGTISGEIYINGATDYNISEALPITYGEDYIFIQSFDGKNHSVYVNDVFRTQELISGVIKAPVLNTHFMLGANPKGTELNNGNNGCPSNEAIYSVLIYNRALTAGEISVIQRLEKEKINI